MLNSTRNPWDRVEDDWLPVGGHWKGSEGLLKAYWLMYEYLRYSPTYELARKQALGLLTEEEQGQLPSDFDEVAATFVRLGPVRSLRFHVWWQRFGWKAFMGSEPEATVRNVGFLASTNMNLTTAVDGLRDYFEVARPKDGYPDCVLLSVPIGMPIEQIQRQVKRIVTAFLEQLAPRPPLAWPIADPLPPIGHDSRMKLLVGRMKSNSLMKGLNLLRTQAKFPTVGLLQLGALCFASKADYWAGSEKRRINPAGGATKDDFEAGARDNLRSYTRKELSKYERVAENAARGRFPTADRVQALSFDYERSRRFILTIGELNGADEEATRMPTPEKTRRRRR